MLRCSIKNSLISIEAHRVIEWAKPWKVMLASQMSCICVFFCNNQWKRIWIVWCGICSANFELEATELGNCEEYTIGRISRIFQKSSTVFILSLNFWIYRQPMPFIKERSLMRHSKICTSLLFFILSFTCIHLILIYFSCKIFGSISFHWWVGVLFSSSSIQYGISSYGVRFSFISF